MTDATLPVALPGPLRSEVERVWPDRGRGMPVSTAVLAVVAGLAGAVLLPESPPGLGLLLVGLLVAAAALPTARDRLGRHEVAFGVLGLLLLSVVVVRDAPWFVALCLLGTAGLSSYALAPGRSLVATALGGLSLPLAAVRGLPWLGRGVRSHVTRQTGSWWPVLRAAGVSLGLLAVFGALFASADEVFASLLPDLHLDLLPVRLFVLVAVAGVAGCGAFLGAAPPRWDVLTPSAARPVRVLEWAAPIALLDLLFAAFVAVQLTVLFGGHRHVLGTAGLTYAEYARGGFGQLVVVTLLTLSVVAAAARWAPRRTGRQRALLRILLGTLGALTLVVVGSALYRLHLYEEAFGFTRLRLFMNAFETWLGVVMLLVLVAGIRLRAAWLPRAIVAAAGVALVTLAVLDPDAFVAERNVERFTLTGKVDLAYLQGLSADAAPAVDRLPEPQRSCVLGGMSVPGDAGLAGWNLGRDRARELLADRPALTGADCAGPDGG